VAVVLPDTLKEVERNGYRVFDLDNDVNLIGIRSPAPLEANEFNDAMHVVYRDGSAWVEKVYPITCDPGRYYLDHPMNKDGCARLRSGQYLKSYKVGLHRNQYRALVQCKPVLVDRIRDGEVVGEARGVFGINIHKAGVNSEFVNRWSAGCQVFQKSDDFDEFLTIVQRSMAQYSQYVTYTLLES
jgi:hypothetical protein